MEIFLIRHGETRYNREARIQGGLNSDLTPEGEQNSRKLGRWLNGWLPPIHVWFSSPQPRALHTARLIRDQLTNHALPELETDDRLREIRCGEYEGKLRKELDPEVMEKLRTDPAFPYPGGESIIDVMKRCEEFLHLLHERRKSHNEEGEPFRAVLVTHGNWIRSMAAVLTGLEPRFALSVIQDNTSINRFRSGGPGGNFRLVTWNETAHLRIELPV